jgi:hypothetical protein
MVVVEERGDVHIFPGFKADKRNAIVYGSGPIACTPPEQMSRWIFFGPTKWTEPMKRLLLRRH